MDFSALWAKQKDLDDPLRDMRSKFHFPQDENSRNLIYFCGNSLGLQTKNTEKELSEILDTWKNKAVEGHFKGDPSWINYNDWIKESMGRLVGAVPNEIAIMNTLSVNLHLLMVSFYKPSRERYKVLIEADAFPSDRYVMESQIRYHGYNPTDALILVKPRPGEVILREEDIASMIQQHAGQLALIFFGGINYLTGQFLNMKYLCDVAHKQECTIGFDLAHAAGNVELKLHDWGVDFAAWCNYKYLNSGPGSIASAFIHQKHHGLPLPRFEGWWGNARESRFLMRDHFEPAPGAEAWVMSTPPTLAIAPIRASLKIFEEAGGMRELTKKSVLLTNYLQNLIQNLNSERIEIITPCENSRRGAQLSIRIRNADKSLFYNLLSEAIIVDWREPDVVRVAPTPLYNSFSDVFNFVEKLQKVLEK